MIIDFQHHYTPPELMENSNGSILTRLNANQEPILRLTPLLADLPAHVRMMDQAGIDAQFSAACRAVISRALPPAA